MITDRIGRHEVLLPINQNCNILQNVGFFKLKTQEIPRIFLLAEKKSHYFKRAHAMTWTCQLQA